MSIQQQRWVWGAILMAAVVLATGYWLLNRPYGETSEQGYQYAVALFSACNQRDVARLQRIAELVTSSRASGELRPAEAEWLTSIIDKGLAGKWSTASRDVRQLMEDQLREADALPSVP